MLPFDISTALWWTSVPKWEWEPLPAPEGEGATAAETTAAADAPAGDGTGDGAADAAPLTRCGVSRTATAAATAGSGLAPAATTPPKPGEQREGFQLVFKGYEIAASVFWYPSDSPLSRPWTAHDVADDRRPRHDDDAGETAAARDALQRAANDGSDDLGSGSTES